MIRAELEDLGPSSKLGFKDTQLLSRTTQRIVITTQGAHMTNFTKIYSLSANVRERPTTTTLATEKEWVRQACHAAKERCA